MKLVASSVVGKTNIGPDSIVTAVLEAPSRPALKGFSPSFLLERALTINRAATTKHTTTYMDVITKAMTMLSDVDLAAVAVVVKDFEVVASVVCEVVAMAVVVTVVVVMVLEVVVMMAVVVVVVVVVVTVVVVVGATVAVHTGDIIPNVPLNMLFLIAFESTQEAPQSVWSKDVASRNIAFMRMTDDTFHADKFWLKDAAL